MNEPKPCLNASYPDDKMTKKKKGLKELKIIKNSKSLFRDSIMETLKCWKAIDFEECLEPQASNLHLNLRYELLQMITKVVPPSQMWFRDELTLKLVSPPLRFINSLKQSVIQKKKKKGWKPTKNG